MICVKELKQRINSAVKRREKFIFAINYEMDKGMFIEDPENNSDILWRVSNNSNFSRIENNNIELHPKFISQEDYAKKFNTLYSGIYKGDSFLANLTVTTALGEGLNLRDIALCAKSKYLLYIPEQFVCFSPEPFIKVSAEGEISSYPMKGTIKAEHPNAKETLLNDPKESAEHNTIVDLIRSDLSRVATNVEVESFRYIEKLTTINGDILQMSSKIKGELLDRYKDNYGDMLFNILPAGSISGAPKPSTLELINRSENTERGYYCGVFGYYDGYELDSSVMIRYIEKIDNNYFYRSGGGITINSDMVSEYNEIKTKVYITR